MLAHTAMSMSIASETQTVESDKDRLTEEQCLLACYICMEVELSSRINSTDS